jgi:hypothetical protein
VLALMSEIIVHGCMDKPSARAIMEAAGISRTHAYDILAGREPPSIKIALLLYDETGEQFGLLKDLSPDAIEQIRSNAAPQEKAA